MEDSERNDKIEEHISDFLELLPHRETVDLFLVVLEERPSCLVMDPDDEEKRKLERFCDDLDLSFLEAEDSEGSMLSDSGFFIAQDRERLDLLKGSDGRFYGFSDLDVGDFLGFPEDDIDYFAENIGDGPLEPETREAIEELVVEGEIDSSEAKLVHLTTYVPRPEESNIKEALSRGKAYREALLDFDEENDTELGSRVMDAFFGQILKN